MITFITAFKKFLGPYDMIQQSAIYSWKINNIRTIAPTNEVGIKEKCSGYDNIFLIEGVKRARELGFNNQSPIVKDLILKALSHIDTVMVALINSDIIISENFNERVQKIVDKYGYDVYMMGTRQDIQLNYYVNSSETYKNVLNEKRLDYDSHTSSDIFIMSKFLWKKVIHDMPDFILGRYGWDNWLHMYAEINSLKKFNCSKALPILHCQHNHQHIKYQEGKEGRDAPSSQFNLKLWNDVRNIYGTTFIKYWPAIEI